MKFSVVQLYVGYVEWAQRTAIWSRFWRDNGAFASCQMSSSPYRIYLLTSPARTEQGLLRCLYPTTRKLSLSFPHCTRNKIVSMDFRLGNSASSALLPPKVSLRGLRHMETDWLKNAQGGVLYQEMRSSSANGLTPTPKSRAGLSLDLRAGAFPSDYLRV